MVIGTRTGIALALTLLLVGPACGAGSSGSNEPGPSSFATPFGDDRIYPRFVSSEVAVGENRFLVGLFNDKDAPVGSPKIDMHIQFFDLDRSSEDPVSETDMDWVWITKPYVGLYQSDVTFPNAGRWGAEVTVSSKNLDETVRSSFDVRSDTFTPAIGEEVPASDTPTAAEVDGLGRISTDPRPDPRFYATSVADALAAHEPFVLVFATPKFCASQTCGPMLDTVKGVAERWPKMTFIHVEPYELPVRAGALRPVAAAEQWGLPTEPWTFVVDSKGRLVAKYEGALGAPELEHELRRLR
ncbi:MAG: TlpA family protein disulfide reductase [Actinomycetota bacterium]